MQAAQHSAAHMCDMKAPAGASRTALHLAAANGHVGMVNRLVTKYAASPIIKDRYGSTPIDDAIRHKHMAVVEFLATQPIATDINSDAYVEQYAPPALSSERDSARFMLSLSSRCIVLVQAHLRSAIT